MIKGPIKITIEGPQGSGKTQIINILQNKLDEKGIEWISFTEGAEFKNYGVPVSIIEKQI